MWDGLRITKYRLQNTEKQMQKKEPKESRPPAKEHYLGFSVCWAVRCSSVCCHNAAKYREPNMKKNHSPAKEHYFPSKS